MKPGTRDLSQRLLAAGIRPTGPRLEMARLLMGRHQHFTAEEALKRLNARLPRISRATLFNNLNLFVEKGLLKKLEIQPGKALFDSHAADHQHAVDRRSGKIVDLKLPPALLGSVKSALIAAYAEEAGASMANVELEIVLRGDSV